MSQENLQEYLKKIYAVAPTEVTALLIVLSRLVSASTERPRSNNEIAIRDIKKAITVAILSFEELVPIGTEVTEQNVEVQIQRIITALKQKSRNQANIIDPGDTKGAENRENNRVRMNKLNTSIKPIIEKIASILKVSHSLDIDFQILQKLGECISSLDKDQTEEVYTLLTNLLTNLDSHYYLKNQLPQQS